MAKSPNQKTKLLHLARMLLRQTDEDHPLTVPEIIERLVLNKINPAAVITDAIYSVSVYDDPGRYTTDIVILIIMSLVVGIVTFIITRRECYDSI